MLLKKDEVEYELSDIEVPSQARAGTYLKAFKMNEDQLKEAATKREKGSLVYQMKCYMENMRKSMLQFQDFKEIDRIKKFLA